MAPLIEVRNLRYRYDDGTVALDGVDFELYPGETVALLGANGSGKTTFVLHLNGLLMGEGSLTVCGTPMTPASAPRLREKVGLVFQDSDNQLFMPTVLEDVAFGPLNLGMSKDQAVERSLQALAQVGLTDVIRKAPYHLSAGEKKRVALAGILAMRPEILVLDEPTTYLDPPGRRALIELLAELPQAKILVTHDTNCALELAHRAVFFVKGKVAGAGPVADLTSRFDWGATSGASTSSARQPAGSR